MNRAVYRAFGTALAGLLLVALVGGCARTEGEGFSIYLTKENVPPAEIGNVSQVAIADQPFIPVADVVRYNVQTHELKLTAAAFDRISKLEVPVSGRSFVVCVDRKPVYGGAFWTPVSSIGFDGVTIWKPYSPGGLPIVTLELGYPAPSFYKGTDPRNGPAILDSLERAGKLVTKLSIAEIESLPESMKGYEIYSWSPGGLWHFTLITGTNRNKTVDEILSTGDFISETGQVSVHVVGVDALQTVLGKLRPGEEVSWLARPRLDPAASGGVSFFSLPPQDAVDSIKSFCGEHGIVLTVSP